MSNANFSTPAQEYSKENCRELTELVITVREQNPYFRTIELEEIKQEAWCFFLEGKVHRIHSPDRGSFWALFAVCFRNYLEDSFGKKFSTVTVPRRREVDRAWIDAAKKSALGHGRVEMDDPNECDELKYSPAEFQTKSYHQEMLRQWEMESWISNNAPILAARLIDQVCHPSMIVHPQLGRSLKRQERIDLACQEFRDLRAQFPDLDNPPELINEIENQIKQHFSSWRGIRGKYNIKTATESCEGAVAV